VSARDQVRRIRRGARESRRGVISSDNDMNNNRDFQISMIIKLSVYFESFLQRVVETQNRPYLSDEDICLFAVTAARGSAQNPKQRAQPGPAVRLPPN
jgi:hypothetical protein